MPTIRLLEITSELSRELADADAFTRTSGVQLGDHAELVRAIVTQGETFRATTGVSPAWGGFLAVDTESSKVVGTCAYKGAPGPAAEVEIAYFTFPPYERRGYGGAMAAALVERARGSGEVRLVYAYTLAEPNASTRILTRRGFANVGSIVDPEDGPLWRWEHPPFPLPNVE
jgi:RimJ/RimL family protein N-acetyltransferase